MKRLFINCFISQEEKRYIRQNSAPRKKRSPLPPWKEMFCSRAYWGLQFSQIANNWGLFTISTATPTFLTTILHVPLAKVNVYVLPPKTIHRFVEPR